MKCVVCGGKIIRACKCPRSDRECENGHVYHWSPYDQQYHEGESDHSMPDGMCCLKYKLKLPVHVVYVCKMGDGWQSEYHELVRGYDDLEQYQNGEFERKQLDINGIEWIDITIEEDVSDIYLRCLLTVDEYFRFMEVDIILKGTE